MYDNELRPETRSNSSYEKDEFDLLFDSPPFRRRRPMPPTDWDNLEPLEAHDAVAPSAPNAKAKRKQRTRLSERTAKGDLAKRD